MLQSSRVVILVKALPQPSKTYGETVCCAGVTADREWKRLYPVRFRHLKGTTFGRWDWVKFNYHRPSRDARIESCHVHEESIFPDGSMRRAEREPFLTPLIVGSALAAAENRRSLALVRPRNTRFIAKPKSLKQIEEEREAYARAARQGSFFDQELAELEPSPYEFRFKFEDDAGKHDYENGDWEAHAMFWRECGRSNAAEALRWMSGKFNDEYPKAGMAFALGNQAKRPQTWQLLGVIRLDDSGQAGLAI
jgi:hypothetical protein